MKSFEACEPIEQRSRSEAQGICLAPSTSTNWKRVGVPGETFNASLPDACFTVTRSPGPSSRTPLTLPAYRDEWDLSVVPDVARDQLLQIAPPNSGETRRSGDVAAALREQGSDELTL